MEEMNLEDILPEKPEFFLKKTNKSYRLRIPTIQDQIFFKNKFKDEESIQKAFLSLDWGILSQVIYYLIEDKSDFLAQDAKIINELGESCTVRLTGPDVLLMSATTEEGLKMVAAFNTAVSLSNPIVKDAIIKEVKKNSARIGAKFLTSSAQNMDGLQNTFLKEPQERLHGDLKQSLGAENQTTQQAPLYME